MKGSVNKPCSDAIAGFAVVCVLLLAAGCENEQKDFGFTESVVQTTATTAVTCTLVASSPESDAVRVAASASTSTTFGVVPNSESCAVSFTLNGASIEPISSGSPFASVTGSQFVSGANTLVATIGTGAVTKTWTVTKNTAPACSNQTPAATGTSITQSSSQSLSVDISDANSDSITATWLLNSASSATLTPTNTATQATAVFQPTASEVGVDTISVQLYDGYDTTTCSWSITVNSSATATVSSCLPSGSSLGSPIVIYETGSGQTQTLSASASGTNLTYQWKIATPAAPAVFNNIAGATSAVLNLTRTEAPMAEGVYRVTVQVTDAYSNTAECPQMIFVKSNDAPAFTGTVSPSISDVKKVNVNAGLNADNPSITFQAGTAIEDLNDEASEGGGFPTYTWTFDGSSHATLVGGTVSATFSPAGDTNLIGSHTIRAVVNDGSEYDSKQWTVYVNYFSRYCNELVSGQICTLVGNPNIGDGLNPDDDKSKIRITPHNVLVHAVGGTDNLVISDTVNHVVWYWNRTGTGRDFFGKTIEAGKMRAVLGSGIAGALSTGTPTKINTPTGLALNTANAADPVLYVSLYSNSRVVAINNSGVLELFKGTQTNNAGWVSTTVTGASGVACTNPYGLGFDPTANLLYVACAGNHSVRAVDVTNASDPTSMMVVKTSAGATAAGDYGSAGAATSYAPRYLAVDSVNRHVYWVEACATTARRGGVVRAYVPSDAAALTYGGAAAINPGFVGTVVGYTAFATNSCNDAVDGVTQANVILGSSVGLDLHPSGMFISLIGSTTVDRILFVNKTGGPEPIGGVSVPSQTSKVVVGNTTNPTSTSDGLAGTSTPINDPYGISYSSTNSILFFADYTLKRLRKFTMASGLVDTLAATGNARSGTAPAASMSAQDVYMNLPTGITYEYTAAGDRNLYYTDFYNYRIVKTDMVRGESSVYYGNGGTNYSDDVDRTLAGSVYPLGLTSTTALSGAYSTYGKFLLFASTHTATGSGRPCLIRAVNQNANSTSIFGSGLIVGSQVRSLIGKLLGGADDGCTPTATVTTNASFTGATANTIPLTALANLNGYNRSITLAVDPSNPSLTVAYVALTERNCIIKIDSSGALSVVVGICQAGTGDQSNVAISTAAAQLTYPKGIYADPAYPTNIFIADQTNAATTKIKYANFSGSSAAIFSNVTVNSGQLGLVLNITGTPTLNSVAATANHICYATGHNASADTGTNIVACKARGAVQAAASVLICGADPASFTTKDGGPLGYEQEGQSCTSPDGSVLLAAPTNLVFDPDGNLYFTDSRNHLIRMVKGDW